jgi:hypothetical protein
MFVCETERIAWQEQVNFQWDDDEVRFVLDQHAEFYLYSASSLKQQSVDRHVAPFKHIILIPSSLLFLLNAACLAKKQDVVFINRNKEHHTTAD